MVLINVYRVVYEKAFYWLYLRAITEAVTRQEFEKPCMKNTTIISRQLKLEWKYVKILLNSQLPREYDKEMVSLPIFSHTSTLQNVFRKLGWNNSLSIEGEYLNHLRFIGEIVQESNSSEELQQLINELDATSINRGYV